MKKQSQFNRRTFVAGLSILPLAGCMSTSTDPISPSLETISLLRNGNIPNVSVGKFKSASSEIERTTSVRFSQLRPPAGKTYADFLGESFQVELVAAGKFDPQSFIAITGVLTESAVSENLSTGGAKLGADIFVEKSGVAAFSKSYRQEAKFNSSFLGAIAIPQAFQQYNALYALLVRQVFQDPEFIGALRS